MAKRNCSLLISAAASNAVLAATQYLDFSFHNPGKLPSPFPGRGTLIVKNISSVKMKLYDHTLYLILIRPPGLTACNNLSFNLSG